MTYANRYKWARRFVRIGAPDINVGRIAKNTVLLYIRMLVVMVIGLFTGRIFLQALGVEDYGLQGVAGATIGLFTYLNGSLAAASSRFITVEMGSGSIGRVKRVFSTLLSVHFAIACVFVVLLETVGVLVLESMLNIDPARIDAVKWIYHCSVVSAFFSMTQVPYGAVIVAHERMGAFAWMTIYDVVVKLVIAMSLLFYKGDRLVLNGTLWMFSGLTTIMIYRIYCIRNFTEARFRRIFEQSMLRPVFAFAGLQIAAQTAIMLFSQGVVMLNQRLFGPSLVAAMSVALTAKNNVEAFISNFKTAANPQIIKLYSAERYEAAENLLVETVLMSVYILLVLAIPVWFYSSELLRLWLGSSVPTCSPLIVKIMLIGSFFAIFDTSLYVILYAAGNLRKNALCNFVVSFTVFIALCVSLRYWRNPYLPAVFVSLFSIILGLVVKPFLLHEVAGYGFSVFCRMYVPSFKAVLITSTLTALVRLSVPSSDVYVVPACILAAILNVWGIVTFGASREIQLKIVKLLARTPLFGNVIMRNGEKYVALIDRVRESFRKGRR